jgi:hypothetical protein
LFRSFGYVKLESGLWSKQANGQRGVREWPCGRFLEKGENDAIAQLRHRPWQRSPSAPGVSQVIVRRLRWLLWALLGSIRVKSITRSGWLVLNRAGVAPAAVAGTKGSPTGANGGPFYLLVFQMSRSRFACAMVINRLSVAPACGMLRHPG